MAWIVVKNWRRFQHYHGKRGVPPWIKVYVELLDNEEYLALSGHQRAVLLGVWVAYARADGQLAANTASLTRRLNLRVSAETLTSLSQAGFIELVLAKPKRLSSPEGETEAEGETEERQRHKEGETDFQF